MTKLSLAPEVSAEQVVLRELMHRTYNEFSSVISAASRAAARSGNQEVKVALAGIIEQLTHYAEVNYALQMPEQDGYINIATYLDNLSQSISRAMLDDLKIALILVASPLKLQSRQCWRLGMMVYELVTNAARHALSNGAGQVRIRVSCARKLVECRVADNGSAPVNFQRGRGLTIVDELVKGLNGRFHQKFSHTGSLSILIFPYSGEPQ